MDNMIGTKPQDNPQDKKDMKNASSYVVAADTAYGVEKFSETDLSTLRSDLLHSGVDSFQAAELVSSFLSGRGYGISSDEARAVATTIEGVGCTVAVIQSELERVARCV